MHPSRPKSIQLVLFDPPDRSWPLNTPQWRSLPPRTRRRASVLMARLFLEHSGPAPAKPGQGSARRAGFDRMVAQVCLGKVGAVAAREVSRFARNSRDWQQLIEMCRVVDTVLVDQEAIYAPRQSNDRLLLELKGSLNKCYA